MSRFFPSDASEAFYLRLYAASVVALSAVSAASLVACKAECPPGSVQQQGICHVGSSAQSGASGSDTESSSLPSSAASTAGASAAGRPGTTPTQASPASNAGSSSDNTSNGASGAAGLGGGHAPVGQGQPATSIAGQGGTVNPTSQTSIGGQGGTMADAAGTEAKPSGPSGPCAGRAGENFCDGPVLYLCDSSETVTSSQACMSADLCQIGVSTGMCAMCSPGSFDCDGAMLTECDKTGRYAPAQQCASADLCNEASGACTPMKCTPNKTVCDSSGRLSTCNGDGSAFLSQMSCGQGLCDSSNMRCNMCVPGAKTCSGTSLMTCSQDGQRVDSEQCPAGGGQCTSASCRSGACTVTNTAIGTPCSSGGTVCDGSGKCVACLEGSKQDCTAQCGAGARTCSGGKWGDCIMNTACPADQDCRDSHGNGFHCLPTGGYLDSCTNCSFANGNLTCTCPKAGNGGTFTSTLKLTCSGDAITNCSGQLSCEDCFQQIVDQGTFNSSCKDCMYNYKSLTCSCLNKDKAYVSSTLTNLPCPAGIDNIDGVLTCSM